MNDKLKSKEVEQLFKLYSVLRMLKNVMIFLKMYALLMNCCL